MQNKNMKEIASFILNNISVDYQIRMNIVIQGANKKGWIFRKENIII